jgi:hypothetical protein
LDWIGVGGESKLGEGGEAFCFLKQLDGNFLFFFFQYLLNSSLYKVLISDFLLGDQEAVEKFIALFFVQLLDFFFFFSLLFFRRWGKLGWRQSYDE